MRHTEPDQPEFQAVDETTEERLRRENEELKRQLQEHKRLAHGSPHTASAGKVWHPSSITIWSITLGVTLLIAAAFLGGYIPLKKRESVILNQAREQEEALPRVDVMEVGRSTSKSDLELPGNIQAVTEAPILARADGYVKTRMVDIGDRVRSGQPLAEIEAPELDQQVLQARANLQQTTAALDQALANQRQGKANMELARVTADRWKTLAGKGVVSRQENDQYQAQYQAQVANLDSLEKAVAAARSNVAAAEANVSRLNEVQSYRVVKAPFDGIITLRNVDVGALVNAGNTLLYRVAQMNVLRTYVNVPQSNSDSIHVGQTAQLTVSNLPGRKFAGTVARTANSLDPNSRTMLVEVQVQNKDGVLLPGMYALVDLSSPRANPPVLLPGDALIVRADGTEVAVVRPDHTIHLQRIQVGRDYGDKLEIVSGLQPGDLVIANPSDTIHEGVKVDPVAQSK
ncbi:MAG TPA: efflux RND transporter periplasmic adaptor subunit [Bryobacteraceae bacterium]|jgi:RND family efflux transporter MFP subunit|nr:efflux RND transporter periplasmic adaptor subunit [Bryobacteraceae bacterium]